MGKTDLIVPPRKSIVPFSPAALAGIAAILIAAGLAFVSICLVVIPLAVFLLACIIAPFFPGLQFFMPVITHGLKNTNAVALTFDDGPSPETTPPLLHLLKKLSVPAMHFVVGAKAASHPHLIKDILAQGHELGNHSMRHDSFLMLKSSANLAEEIAKCQGVLESFGILPLAFRPPVGIVNPRLRKQLLKLGMYCITFSRRGRDWGNRKVKGIAYRIVNRVRPGDIIMLHDCLPKGDASVEQWLGEVEETIAGIRAKGLRIVRLAELIGIPVMAAAQSTIKPDKA